MRWRDGWRGTVLALAASGWMAMARAEGPAVPAPGAAPRASVPWFAGWSADGPEITDAAPEPGESPPPAPPPPPRTLRDRLLHCDDGTDRSDGWLRHFAASDRATAPVFDTGCDVGWHKPIFILPYTYSPDYNGHDTEVVFEVSAKLRPLGPPLYFAYTQRSFWSLYDGGRSRPFRETDYNPEAFYRWTPPPGWRWPRLGADIGIEHESNGQDLPKSRSWNRVYVAPFWERHGTGAQLKMWYRLPENRKRSPDDASGDDNPDIQHYYGYTELHVFRRIGADDRWHLMARGNSNTGKGAVSLEYDWRIGDGDLFGQASVFHGYGESLLDYNDSVTRVGIGVALAR